MKNLFTLLLIMLSVFSCASANTSFFPTANSLPAYTGQVAVLDQLPEKYVDVGWINIKSNHTWIDMFQAAKEKAGQYGANAIVYSPANCRYAGNGVRSIVCRAVYLEGK